MIKKDMTKFTKIFNDEKLKDESDELWLRAKVLMQYIVLREKLNLSQRDVAKKMGIAHQQIAKFEALENSPTLTFLVKYAKVLHTNINITLDGVTIIECDNRIKKI